MIDLINNKSLELKNNVIRLNDMLFLHQQLNKGQQQFEYFLGNKKIDKKQIRIFKSNMKENKRISLKYNFTYKHIIFPSKPTIFKKEFEDIGIKINNIVTKKHTKISDVHYPDYLNTEDYPKDDSHINSLGTLKIIQNIFNGHNVKLFSDEPIISETLHLGDLSKMYDGIPRKRKRVIFQSCGGDKDFFKNAGYSNRYTQMFSNRDSLKGNTGLLSYLINPFALNKKRIVLFGDSFFGMKLNLFSMIFEEVIFARTPYIIEEYVEILKPDIVLTGNVERYLVDVPSIKNPNELYTNYIKSNFMTCNLDSDKLKAFNSLFKGRNNKDFIKFKKRFELSFSTDMDKLLELKNSDIRTYLDVIVCRDLAIYYEKDDIYKSYHLMGLAYNAKPNGPVIKKKYNEYIKKSEEKIISV